MKKKLIILVLIGLAWFFVHSVIIVVDGFVDEVEHVDAIVVLGNMVNDDGSPSPRLQSRLDKAAELYEEGYADWIFLSGGISIENGQDEADGMANYLESLGISKMNMISDREGFDTYVSAKNTKQFMEWYGWDSVLIVSNYYHISRSKLAFNKVGIENVYSASADFYEIRDFYSIFREFAAYYYYVIRRYTADEDVIDFSELTTGEPWNIKIIFPENLSLGDYISTFDEGWPPEFTVLALYPEGEKPLVCEQDSDEIEIGGSKYCVRVVEEGAAGSIYKNYEYITRMWEYKTLHLSFGLRYSNCGVYDNPELCETEQAGFDVNELVHRILSAAEFSD